MSCFDGPRLWVVVCSLIGIRSGSEGRQPLPAPT
jgi:hypothetical protein